MEKHEVLAAFEPLIERLTEKPATIQPAFLVELVDEMLWKINYQQNGSYFIGLANEALTNKAEREELGVFLDRTERTHSSL